MLNPLSFLGERFGRLLVLADGPMRGGHRCLRCRCDCGTEKDVAVTSLVGGHTQSCGCKKHEQLKWIARRHGESHRTPEYRAWVAMKERCRDTTRKDFQHYGGRGIQVCAAWRESYPAFLADVGRRPPGHSLDRIDVNGHYEPGNVRWATQQQQVHNRRPRAEWFHGTAL